MTFLTPLLAGIAAAIAVPTLVILYFLKLRRREVEISTTMLWKKAIEDLQANAPFQKLRRNLLLFLQLLALLAALFAIAQPEIKTEQSGGFKHVILIDRSASMQALDGGPANAEGADRITRLAAAKREAIELVNAFQEPGLLSGSGDEAMVIAFDNAAEVRQSFTSSKPALRAAIESIEAVDTGSSVREALKLAKAYAPLPADIESVERAGGLRASGPPARLHIYSDGRLPDAGKLAEDPNKAGQEISPDDDVVYHAVGKSDAWNVGIVGLRAQRAFNNPSRISIYVGLQSTARVPKTVDVQISVDGRQGEVRAVPLAAAQIKEGTVGGVRNLRPRTDANTGEVREEPVAEPAVDAGELIPATGGVVFSLDRSDGAVFAIAIVSPDKDVLPVDDLGYVVVSPAKALAVALITPGNFFLPDALASMNLSRLETFTPTQAAVMLTSPMADEFDVFVLDRWLPEGRDAKGGLGKMLPAGRSLVFGAVPPAPLGMNDLGPGEPTVIIDWAREHPALRNVGLETLLINPGRQTEKSDGSLATVLATAQGGPAIFEVSDPNTRGIVVTFDILESNWWRYPDFLLFILNSLTYLGNEANVAGDGVRPGSVLSERLPAAARNVTLGLPDKTRADLLPTPDGRVAYGPVRHVGIYTVSWTGPTAGGDVEVDGRARRAVAANLLDSEESDIRTLEVLPLASRVVQAEPPGGQRPTKLWPILLLAALAVVLLEWFIYNRKVIV